MTDKLELKSSHEVVNTVYVADVESIFQGKPTDPDILTVLMKDGKRLYCDEVCLIDSLQEESVAPKVLEDMLNAKTAAESLGISAEEHDKIIDLCLYGEKPVSEQIDFEKELYKAFGQVEDFTLGMRIAKWFYDIGKKSREPVSDDLEEAAELYMLNQDTYNSHVEYQIKGAFKAGAKWQKEQIMEALLSEVLPCFMHGGEADEVVAKLDEVLNFQKK